MARKPVMSTAEFDYQVKALAKPKKYPKLPSDLKIFKQKLAKASVAAFAYCISMVRKRAICCISTAAVSLMPGRPTGCCECSRNLDSGRLVASSPMLGLKQ